MPTMAASWARRALGGVGVLGVACLLLAAPAWAGAGVASAPVTLTVRLPARGWVGGWTTMRVAYDNRSKRRAVVSVRVGLRDTGLVRASRVRLERRSSAGRWVPERLVPGDEEYVALERAVTLPPGRGSVQYRLRSAKGPGTLRVRVLAVAGSHGARVDFRHPIASDAAFLTVARRAVHPRRVLATATPTAGVLVSSAISGSASPTSLSPTVVSPTVVSPTVVSPTVVSPTVVSRVGVESAAVTPAAVSTARRGRAGGGGQLWVFGVVVAALAVCAAAVPTLLRRARPRR